jgi:hypothetical protein
LTAQSLLGAANAGMGEVISLFSGVVGLASGAPASPGVGPTSIDVAVDPADPAPGGTAVLTVLVRGHHGAARYGIPGAPVQVSLGQQPGSDAQLSATSLLTDSSGAATTVLTLSGTRGRHAIRATSGLLTTQSVIDTRVGPRPSQRLDAGLDRDAFFVGAIGVLLIGLLVRVMPPIRLRPSLITRWRRSDRPYGNRRTIGSLLGIAGGAVLLAVVVGHVPVLVVAGAIGALVLFGLTTWRPVIGLLVLALAVPLTAGMGRNPILPMVPASASLSVLVALGMLAHFLPQRRKIGFTTLDVVVAAFTIGGALVPWAVLYLSKQSVGVETWQSVLSPLQYLVVYLVFSRLEVTPVNLRRILGLEMLASVIIGVVGLVQLANPPGIRGFIASTYPIAGQLNACQLGNCPPTSLLAHWSAFGAFAVLNYAVALALLCTPAARFSRRWLMVVMAVNVLAVAASQTPVAMIGLVLVTGIVLVHRGRVPRQLPAAVAALAIAAGVFWTQVQVRAEPQPAAASAAATTSSSQPNRNPSRLVVPLIQDHLWAGTGTVVPTGVPDRVAGYIDNQYLRMSLRGGIVGEALLLLLLASVAVAGWHLRRNPRPLVQALGAITLTFAVVLAVLGTSADYIDYAGVSQLFWMMLGLIGGSLLPVLAAGRNNHISLPSVARKTLS